MDISHLAVQVTLTIACAGVANLLIPRRISGGLAGLMAIGFVGVAIGEWSFVLIAREFGITHPILRWHFQGVEIVPAVIGSAIVLYVFTALFPYRFPGKKYRRGR